MSGQALPQNPMMYVMDALVGEANIETLTQTTSANTSSILAALYANFMAQFNQQLQIVMVGGQHNYAEQNGETPPEGSQQGVYDDPYDKNQTYNDPGMPEDPSSDDATNMINETQITFNLVQTTGNSDGDILNTIAQNKSQITTMLGQNLQQLYQIMSNLVGMGDFVANLLASPMG